MSEALPLGVLQQLVLIQEDIDELERLQDKLWEILQPQIPYSTEKQYVMVDGKSYRIDPESHTLEEETPDNVYLPVSEDDFDWDTWEEFGTGAIQAPHMTSNATTTDLLLVGRYEWPHLIGREGLS